MPSAANAYFLQANTILCIEIVSRDLESDHLLILHPESPPFANAESGSHAHLLKLATCCL